jgi:hypothetical protein
MVGFTRSLAYLGGILRPNSGRHWWRCKMRKVRTDRPKQGSRIDHDSVSHRKRPHFAGLSGPTSRLRFDSNTPPFGHNMDNVQAITAVAHRRRSLGDDLAAQSPQTMWQWKFVASEQARYPSDAVPSRTSFQPNPLAPRALCRRQGSNSGGFGRPRRRTASSRWSRFSPLPDGHFIDIEARSPTCPQTYQLPYFR